MRHPLLTLATLIALIVGAAGVAPAGHANSDPNVPVPAASPATQGASLSISGDPEVGIVTESASGDSVSIGIATRSSAGGLVVGDSAVFADRVNAVEVTAEPVDVSDFPDLAGAVRQVITIRDAKAPTRYRIPIELPAGGYLEENADRTIAARDGDGKILGMFGAPWAFQAGGQRVDTRFEIASDGALVQVVEHRGAEYPVIADPVWFVPVFVVGTRVAIKVGVKALTKKGAQRAANKAVRGMGYTPRITGTAIRGTFATAGGFTIRVNKTPLRKHGYRNYKAFLDRWGPAGKDRQWHHIVEQSAVRSGTSPIRRWEVNNRVNLIAIPTAIHQKCVSAMMSTKLKNIPPQQLSQLGVRYSDQIKELTLRQYQSFFSFENLHLIGLRLLALCGLNIKGSGI